MRYQKVAAVFSPIIGALARVPADTEHDSLQEAERELTTENIIKDVALSGNNALNLANISDCDTISGPKPQVCMGVVVFTNKCSSCHTDRLANGLAKTRDRDQLDKYLESPHGPVKHLKGSEVFKGIKEPHVRSDLIAYLKAV